MHRYHAWDSGLTTDLTAVGFPCIFGPPRALLGQWLASACSSPLSARILECTLAGVKWLAICVSSLFVLLVFSCATNRAPRTGGPVSMYTFAFLIDPSTDPIQPHRAKKGGATRAAERPQPLVCSLVGAAKSNQPLRPFPFFPCSTQQHGLQRPELAGCGPVQDEAAGRAGHGRADPGGVPRPSHRHGHLG